MSLTDKPVLLVKRLHLYSLLRITHIFLSPPAFLRTAITNFTVFPILKKNVEFRRFLVVNVVWMLLGLHAHQSFITCPKSFRPCKANFFGR